MDDKFPRAPGDKPSVLSGKVWNHVADVLENAGKLSVAPPLNLADGPYGKTLTISLPPGLVLIRLVTTAPGAGTYLGRVQVATSNEQLDTTDLNLATWYTDLNSFNDAVYENTAENLGGSGSHLIIPVLNTYVLARLSGRYENSSPSSPVPIYEGYQALPGNFIAGTFCDANTPVYVDTSGIQAASFQIDDFDISFDSTGGISRVRVEWHGFTVYNDPPYGGAPTDAVVDCAVKVIHLDQSNDVALPTVAETQPTPNANRYNLKWSLDKTELADPCATCAEPDTKGAATISADIYINPCDYLPTVTACDNSTLASVGNFIFSNGLKTVFPDGASCAAGTATATVTLDISVNTGNAYANFDLTGCQAKLNLCTQTLDVVTGGGTCISGGISLTTTSVTVLQAC